LTPEERSAINRANINARWAKRRAERIAAGLPPTQAQERRRKPRFIDDLDVETFWIGELERLGLADGLDRLALRTQAKRLADAATAELAELAPDEASRPPEGDDETRAAYWRHEAALWRRRAERDIAMARMHLERADDAERELGMLLLKLGRA